MMAVTFFYCGLSFAGALQDMRKFSGLGFSYPFGYYLKENNFLYGLLPFFCVTAEFAVYLALRKRRSWLVLAMWVLHGGMWVHAMILSVPAGNGYNSAGHYLRFAELTLLPTVGYFVSCFLQVKEYRRKSADKR